METKGITRYITVRIDEETKYRLEMALAKERASLQEVVVGMLLAYIEDVEGNEAFVSASQPVQFVERVENDHPVYAVSKKDQASAGRGRGK